MKMIQNKRSKTCAAAASLGFQTKTHRREMKLICIALLVLWASSLVSADCDINEIQIVDEQRPLLLHCHQVTDFQFDVYGPSDMVTIIHQTGRDTKTCADSTHCSRHWQSWFQEQDFHVEIGTTSNHPKFVQIQLSGRNLKTRNIVVASIVLAAACCSLLTAATIILLLVVKIWRSWRSKRHTYQQLKQADEIIESHDPYGSCLTGSDCEGEASV